MAYDALRDFSQRDMTFRFVSNVDGTDFWEATHDLDPAETLFVISSKTFTTLETLTNAAHGARVVGSPGSAATSRRWPSTSSRCRRTRQKVAKFGIDTANMFEFWDWVGGRYSYDSAIGLSLMIADRPRAVRRDARRLPRRSTSTSAPRRSSANLPVLLGLIGIWYDDFFGAETQADPPVQPVPRPLPGVPPAARHGERRQVGRPRGQPGHDADRPDRVGPARHQRPARVLPAHPPGHEADPVRLHRVRARQPRGRRPPEPAHGQPLRADRGARVREDRGRGRGRGRARAAGAAPHVRRATTRPTRSSPSG